MLRGDPPHPLPFGRQIPGSALVLAVLFALAACGGSEEPMPTSMTFADDENAATLNGITVVCETDGVTVHSDRYEIENIVLNVDGVHTRVDNIFAFDFVVAGAFDRMTIDSDPTIEGDDLPENRIEALWVKAGNNLSADGPGYGQRMACPTVAVETAREAHETKNYVAHDFGPGEPADDSAAAAAEVEAEVEPADDPADDPDGDAGETAAGDVDGDGVEIGAGPQIFAADGALVLRCGSGGIEVSAENSELVSVIAFDRETGEDMRFVDIGARSLSLLGAYGDVSATTAAGVEATFSCAIANRRGDRTSDNP